MTTLSQAISWTAHGFASFFYVTSPADAVEDVHKVPKYLVHALPFFAIAIVIEFLVSLGHDRKKRYFRLNDSFSSITAGILQQLSTFFLRGIEIASYIWVYDNFNLIKLDWSAPSTYWLCFLGVDLGYYLFHRYAHEINLFWAAHVVHHSSENYNLTTALRQSVFQTYTSWFFYLPLALAIPPSIFAIHRQFDTLYQFWIHTELVGSLGPLEWILNTPSHHRVHHGRNRYCIDKNYAGTLIIWDRLFGTFASEDEPVVYGLTHPIGTWDPLWTQVHHIVHIAQKVYAVPGIGNKLSALFKGPGWVPGSERLGDPNGIPDVRAPWPQYDTTLPSFLSLYVCAHFVLVMIGFTLLASVRSHLPVLFVNGLALYLLYSLTSFGAMFDRKKYAFAMEISRIILFLVLELGFWYGYGDEFVFLWYRDPSVPGYVHRPLKAVRAFYIFSGLWLVGRFFFFSFYGQPEVEEKLQQQQQQLEKPQSAEASSTTAATTDSSVSNDASEKAPTRPHKSVKAE
ncbi:transmembrane protein [Capsaspora owczarzaki ATCC 30864]|uniref:Alkylglycerol monooxygenase n=1 Tax=Capsaspora owczarzaki (strain ATCC 30864) TaxID=595528 RepID=A0A0D2VKG9_CAPO3|nr:transmembrane protein [Capsaspora owczarzaki ATCC 30864]KJE90512.1 transmembrane protein [Capsaspora owczarzaki ATCC 30864]|eukprot:XP_004364690.2 transmembrane protein [Capsaspora owczarzaki ATCC 30864]